MNGTCARRMTRRDCRLLNPAPTRRRPWCSRQRCPLAPPVESDPEFAGEPLDAIESTRVPPRQIDPGAEITPANRSPAAMPKRPSSIDKAPLHPHTYIIRRGDTLSAIATRIYRDGSQWSIISEANRGLDPKRLSVGRALMLPDRPVRWP